MLRQQPLNPTAADFTPLPWQVLLPVLLAFALVISPNTLEQPTNILVMLTMLCLAGASASHHKVHALGLGIIGIPAVMIMFLHPGSLADKSWAALLSMLEFFILEQLLWGLEEDTAQPWRFTALLWVLMPSAIGLLGMLLLMLLSHARWQAGLARANTKQSRPKDWLLILTLLIGVMLVSIVLPFPKYQAIQTPNMPVLSFSSLIPKVTPPRPPEIIAPNLIPKAPRQQPAQNNWISGLSTLSILVFAYLIYTQRVLRNNAPTRATKPTQHNNWLWFLLLTITATVLIIGFAGLGNPTRIIQVQFGSSQAGIFALLFFLALFMAWRIAKKRHQTKPNEPLGNHHELEALRYLAPKDAVRAAYFKWLVLLRDLEIRRYPTQTPLEFLSVVNNLHVTMRDASQTLTESYQRVRYGTTPSQNELEAVLNAFEQWQTEIAKQLPPEITPQMVGSTP